MNKITKGDARAFYTKMKREERKKMAANVLLLLPVIGILFWLAGCSSQQPETVMEKLPNKLQQEWDKVYSDYEMPHPPRSYGYDASRDYEVDYLNGLLNEHGITVFRINPDNPEHQRRYRRHLEEPDNFYTLGRDEVEMDI